MNAVCDVLEQRIAEARKIDPGAQAYPDHRRLLDAADRRRTSHRQGGSIESAHPPPTFNDAQNFQNGFAQVQQGTKWITIDPQGNTVDPDKRKLKPIAPASDGLAKLAFPLRKYDEAYSFSGGLARFKLDGTYSYLDKSGNPQIPNQFANAGDFNHGLAAVQLPNGASAYIDPQATIVWR